MNYGQHRQGHGLADQTFHTSTKNIQNTVYFRSSELKGARIIPVMALQKTDLIVANEMDRGEVSVLADAAIPS